MLDKIDRNDPIFQSSDFLKDAMAFNVMVSVVEDVKQYPEIKVYSNRQNCIVVNSDNAHPVIVWTRDDFDDFQGLYDFLMQEFGDNQPLEFASKLPVYDFIAGKCQLTPPHRLGVYHCDELIPVPYVGYADNIRPDEVETVADLVCDFYHETKTDESATRESCLPMSREFLDNPFYLVWRNESGQIVSLARMRETEKFARAGHILTLPSERGKSYAKMLLHFLTQRAFEKGKIPMLFTNYDYEPSNKCYPKVGYVLDCVTVMYKVAGN